MRGDGRLKLLLDNVPSPNGLVLIPNGDMLYLDVTRNNALWRARSLEDGNLGRARLDAPGKPMYSHRQADALA